MCLYTDIQVHDIREQTLHACIVEYDSTLCELLFDERESLSY